MSPPERLRAELERHRRRGRRFKAVWPAAVSAALRDEHFEAAIFWRRTWREQRPLWQVSYSRVAWPANQRPALSPFDYDRSTPAKATGRAPVAA